MERAPLSSLQGGDAKENACILQAIFDGETGAGAEIVLLNAAAALVTAGMVRIFALELNVRRHFPCGE